MSDFEKWWEKTKSIVSNSDRVFAGSIAKIAFEAGRKAWLEEFKEAAEIAETQHSFVQDFKTSTIIAAAIRGKL